MHSEHTPHLSEMDSEVSDAETDDMRVRKRMRMMHNSLHSHSEQNYYNKDSTDKFESSMVMNPQMLYNPVMMNIQAHRDSPRRLINGGTTTDSFTACNSALHTTPKSYIVEVPPDAREGDTIHIVGSKLGINTNFVAVQLPAAKYIMTFPSTGDRYFKVAPPGALVEGCRILPYSPVSPPITLSPSRRSRLSDRKTARQKAVENERILSKTSSKVGSNHQVSYLPDPHDFHSKPPTNELHKQIWDPTRASNNILGVLDNLPTNHKEIMMESLHVCNYDLETGYPIYLRRIKELRLQGKLPGDVILNGVKKIFHKAIWEKRKDLKAAINVVREKGYELNNASLLVNYYNTFKTTQRYTELKKAMKAEPDVCIVCQDGGTLVLCDGCSNAYHMGCLDPPLKEIPEGFWFCPQCVTPKPKDGKHKSVPAYAETSNGDGKGSSNEWTYWGINYA